jgi:hypothetical protein
MTTVGASERLQAMTNSKDFKLRSLSVLGNQEATSRHFLQQRLHTLRVATSAFAGERISQALDLSGVHSMLIAGLLL